MRMTTIVLLSVLITGCFGLFKGSEEIDTTTHPNLPTPVEPYQIEWEVITEENASSIIDGDSVYIGMEYEDGINYFRFMEDVKRYILEGNQVICYYREELDEAFCANQEKYLIPKEDIDDESEILEPGGLPTDDRDSRRKD